MIKREIRPSEVRESAVFVNLRTYGRKNGVMGGVNCQNDILIECARMICSYCIVGKSF